jgi:hypothetical protein
MADNLVSIDEFLNARKGFVKSGDILMKAARSSAPSWNRDTRTVRFVMSAEVEDRDKDIINQAGLDIAEFLKNPIAFWAHMSRDFPVGKWSDLNKALGGRPKRTEGVLNVVEEGGEPLADRLAFHLNQGTIRACSIGFIPKLVKRREVAQEADEWKWPGYDILEAELVECSPCGVPANPAALAKAAAAGDVHAREMIEDVLDSWAKHPETGLLVPRSEFESAYKTIATEKTTIVVPPAPVDDHEMTQPEAKSLIRRAFDLILGSDSDVDFAEKLNRAEIQAAAELQAKTAAEEKAAEEAAADLAKRRAALEKRNTELEARLKAKSLV